MLLRIVFTLLALSFSHLCSANITAKPASCPRVEVIKAQGLTQAGLSMGGQDYIVYHVSHYDLNQKWAFALAYIGANSEQEAVHVGNKMLSTLSGNPGPLPDDHNDGWLCHYDIGNQTMAFAYTGENLPLSLMMHQYKG